MRVRLVRFRSVAGVLSTAILVASACSTPVEEFPSAPAPTFDDLTFFDAAAGAPGTEGAAPTPETTAPATATTTSTATTVAREVRPTALAVGDCVTWNRSDPTSVLTPQEVDCAASHLGEVTATIDLSSAAAATAAYPEADAWDAFVQSACRQEAITHLGRHDPAGRFAVQAFRPGPDGWAAGDRFVVCLVTARDSRVDPITLEAAVPFTGRAAEIEQTLLFDPGTCLVVDAEGRLDAAVPCGQAHQLEVSGTVDVTAEATTMPADRVAWRDLVADDCRKVTAAYLGRDPRPTEGVFWSMLTTESWDAGRRELECVVAELDANGAPVTRTAPLRR